MARWASSTAVSKPKDLSMTCHAINKVENVNRFEVWGVLCRQQLSCWQVKRGTGMSLSMVLGIPATTTLRPRLLTSCRHKEKYFPTSIRCSQFKLLPSMKLILSSDQMKGRKISYLPRSYRKPARKKFNLFHQLLIFYKMEFTSYITDAPFWVPSPPIM